MITLLYGDDQVSLQEYLLKLKDDYKDREILEFDLNSAKEDEVERAFNSPSLIASDRLVILENWFGRKSKKIDFSHANLHLDIILVERSRIKQEQIRELPQGTKVFFFRQDPLIFKFLDSLIAGEKKKAFYFYARLLSKHTEPEMIFYLLVSHLRRVLLAGCKNNALAKIEQLAPWQIEKYQRLASRFNKEKLISFYPRLLDLEESLKSGSDLTGLLPFVILELTRDDRRV